jgi:hypothetical protein
MKAMPAEADTAFLNEELSIIYSSHLIIHRTTRNVFGPLSVCTVNTYTPVGKPASETRFTFLKIVSLIKTQRIMLTAVKATYENGQIIWQEKPAIKDGTAVIVTYMDEEAEPQNPPLKGVRLGSWQGKYSLPDDFNDPLDDLADYM